MGYHVHVKKHIVRLQVAMNNRRSRLMVKIIHCSSNIYSGVEPLEETQDSWRLICTGSHWMQPFFQTTIGQELVDESLEVVHLIINA
ncbi:unnamed protein product [Linum tenue]|uniref:Uncharacterized protein n=1 Tax=Linum tenue TaxID=586396 RepID=A0AAV0IGX1_9ROSI|nr:unnamed protein product [Linum tenue]